MKLKVATQLCQPRSLLPGENGNSVLAAWMDGHRASSSSWMSGSRRNNAEFLAGSEMGLLNGFYVLVWEGAPTPTEGGQCGCGQGQREAPFPWCRRSWTVNGTRKEADSYHGRNWLVFPKRRIWQVGDIRTESGCRSLI